MYQKRNSGNQTIQWYQRITRYK